MSARTAFLALALTVSVGATGSAIRTATEAGEAEISSARPLLIGTSPVIGHVPAPSKWPTLAPIPKPPSRERDRPPIEAAPTAPGDSHRPEDKAGGGDGGLAPSTLDDAPANQERAPEDVEPAEPDVWSSGN
jgi:hypothetical protein